MFTLLLLYDVFWYTVTVSSPVLIEATFVRFAERQELVLDHCTATFLRFELNASSHVAQTKHNEATQPTTDSLFNITTFTQSDRQHHRSIRVAY